MQYNNSISIKNGSYLQEDVIFLLKDISNLLNEKSNKEREVLIQSGTHYSEMLPIEYKPSDEYMQLFYDSLKISARKLAIAVGIVCEKIIQNRGNNIILVSLARAGTPAGVLMKRYYKIKYNYNIPHYSISIIRDRGIDENAIKFLLNKYPNKEIQFIDGWTGKGAITKELHKACLNFNKKYGKSLDNRLAVIADPGYCVEFFGTREDFLIPSACLNSTVSGLVSRTVLRDDLIGKDDFHGAKVYKELIKEDVSRVFVDTISKYFGEIGNEISQQINSQNKEIISPSWIGLEEIKRIQKDFNIANINHIKPGVGETTRVLLRRIPWKILINKNNENLNHIIQLAKERNVVVEEYPLTSYQCCGLIKKVVD